MFYHRKMYTAQKINKCENVKEKFSCFSCTNARMLHKYIDVYYTPPYIAILSEKYNTLLEYFLLLNTMLFFFTISLLLFSFFFLQKLLAKNSEFSFCAASKINIILRSKYYIVCNGMCFCMYCILDVYICFTHIEYNIHYLHGVPVCFLYDKI